MKAWTDECLMELGALIDAGLSIRMAAARLGRGPGSVISAARSRGWRFGQPRRPDQCVPPFPRLSETALRSERPRLDPIPPEEQLIRFSVQYDPETLAVVKALARRERMSVGAKIRELVEWGLEAQREYDRAA